jgi:hypothetical protein
MFEYEVKKKIAKSDAVWCDEKICRDEMIDHDQGRRIIAFK